MPFYGKNKPRYIESVRSDKWEEVFLENKPIVYIFHGDDEQAIQQAMDGLFKQLGDPVTAEMNTTRLDGGQAGEAEILNAAATMPFLAERRLVILTNPFSRLKEKAARDRFCEMLEGLPWSAALVLVVNDHLKRQRLRSGEWVTVWEVLNQVDSQPDRLNPHWLLTWAETAGEKVFRKGFALPEQAEMPRWIQQRAQELGGRFSLDAAQELAALVENNTRLAAVEIEKLLTYVNLERPVEVQDVQQLTASYGQANIFDMVDALGHGNKTKAVELLHDLLEEEGGFAIFPMVVRQFRLLLQAREILDEGKGVEHIQRELHVAGFVAKKINYQAGRFSLDELKRLYQSLLEIDIASKTGEMSADLALDIFIAKMN
jgi:DNA polymerase-3 subunit delta